MLKIQSGGVRVFVAVPGCVLLWRAVPCHRVLCHHVLCCAARVVGVLMPKILMNTTDAVLSGSEIVVIISNFIT